MSLLPTSGEAYALMLILAFGGACAFAIDDHPKVARLGIIYPALFMLVMTWFAVTDLLIDRRPSQFVVQMCFVVLPMLPAFYCLSYRFW